MPDESSADKKSIGVALVQNTPLAIIVIGLFLALLGAAGGWPKYGLQITELGWRISIGLMGLVCAGVGLVLYKRRDNLGPSREELEAARYGIRIASPGENDFVSNRVDVKGSYEIKPGPDIEAWVLEFSPTSQKFYPKRRVIFDQRRKNWEAIDFGIGGKNSDKRILIVAVLGLGGQALCNYYQAAGEENKRWPGIPKLTPDSVECDRVTVKIKISA